MVGKEHKAHKNQTKNNDDLFLVWKQSICQVAPPEDTKHPLWNAYVFGVQVTPEVRNYAFYMYYTL